MVPNALFWVHHIRDHYIPFIDAFADSVRQRFLPTFETVGDEAEQIKNEVFDRFGQSANENLDMGDAADHAQDAGIAHIAVMHHMKQGFLNMFTVGLYHIFEQQFLLFHRSELLGLGQKNQSLFTLREATARLAAHGIDLTIFATRQKIYELQVVCDAIKHADGRSCEDLKKLRPTLFAPFLPGEPESPLELPYLPGLKIFGPLSGEGIYVSEEAFYEYVDVVKGFWTEFSDALDRQGKNA